MAALMILLREIIVSGLREFSRAAGVGAGERARKVEDHAAAGGARRADPGGACRMAVGAHGRDRCLWAAAALTLISG